MKLKLTLVMAQATLIFASAASAQNWPQKPVKLIVSFPPGSPGDMIARLIQPDLQKTLGQAIVIENKPGAGGNIGAQEVARSADGHTFLVGPDTMFSINPHLYQKLSFKPLEDLQVLTQLASFNQILVCHPTVGVKTLADLASKSKSSKMDYASGGAGVPGHMAMEMLMTSMNITMNHIPYKGPAPATQDVLAGQVPCGFLAAPVVGPHVKDGKLVALGASGARRSPGSPQIQTIAEAGVPGFDAGFFEVMAAPKGTPADAVDKMQKAVTSILSQTDIKSKLLAADLEPVGNSSASAQSRTKMDFEKWGRIANQIGLKLD